VARKHSLYVWGIVQDLAQLEDAFKKTGQRSWLASPAVLQFFGVNDLETAEMLSKRCGDYTALQESENTSKGHTNNAGGASSGSSSNTKGRNIQGTRTALISPDEIMSLMVDAKGVPEEQLLFIRGRRPLRCGLPKYYRRKEMAGLVAGNPYYRPSAGKPQGKSSHQMVMAGAYGFGLLAVAASAAMAPLPLMVGDDAVIVGGEEKEPIFGMDGRPLGTAPVGWRVRVTSLPRPDGFVAISFLDPHGTTWNTLIHKNYLEMSRQLPVVYVASASDDAVFFYPSASEARSHQIQVGKTPYIYPGQKFRVLDEQADAVQIGVVNERGEKMGVWVRKKDVVGVDR
jgi:hypothetical protein